MSAAVTGVAPQDGAADVTPDFGTQTITATFDGDIDTSTMTTSTIRLTSPARVTPTNPTGMVPAVPSWDAATRTLRLTPSSGLEPSAQHTVTIDGVVAADGSAIQPRSWSFTTNNVRQPHRFNCGGPAYATADGRVFAAEPGSPTAKGGVVKSGLVVSGADAALFADYREGVSSTDSITYIFPFVAGPVTVKLYAADPTYSVAGKRVLKVTAAGGGSGVVLPTLDIAAEAGGKAKPLVKTIGSFNVGAGGGGVSVRVQWVSGVGFALVAAIELLPA